jgi:purine catabolism regulator
MRWPDNATVPSLTQLCALLGPDLAPLTPLPDSVEVTGVHVSELTDPTPYLDGGELLLTTGIPLLAPTAAVHAYVARLQRAGVSGLGFGLGALRDTIPDGLAAACQRLGLALFGVPGPTPFQAIARGYWTLVGQERAAELTSTIGSYRKLVRAAAAPTPQVVRELADTLKGWSVHFDEEGRPLAAWPPEAIEPGCCAPAHTAQRRFPWVTPTSSSTRCQAVIGPRGSSPPHAGGRCRRLTATWCSPHARCWPWPPNADPAATATTPRQPSWSA